MMRARGLRSLVMMRAVQECESVEHEIDQKPQRDAGQQKGVGMKFLSELDRLGEKIEERHANDGTSAEAEDEMEFVLESQRDKPAGNGGAECGESDQGEGHIR